MSSNKTLLDALREYNRKLPKSNPVIEDIMNRTARGHYNECTGPLETPIVQLVKDLTRAGALELAEDAKNGRFDATSDEWQAWETSPEGQAVINSPEGRLMKEHLDQIKTKFTPEEK